MSNVLTFIRKNFSEETIYYVTNPGNAGDALIGYGALCFFKRHNIRYKFIVDIESPELEGKVVFYAGGGYLTSFYPQNAEKLLKLLPRVKHLVLLPQTTEGSASFLSSVTDNVTLFAREKVTHQYLLDAKTKAEIILDHDMAFELEVKQLFQDEDINFLARLSFWAKMKFDKTKLEIKWRHIYRSFRHSSKYRFKAFLMKDPKRLNAFRYDEEASGIAIPQPNIDVSYSLQFGIDSEERLCYTSYRFLSFINSFDVVHTDRLHVAIGSAMLGKRVFLYGNSYFKCRAIFEHSLAGRYPQVTWVSNSEGLKHD